MIKLQHILYRLAKKTEMKNKSLSRLQTSISLTCISPSSFKSRGVSPLIKNTRVSLKSSSLFSATVAAFSVNLCEGKFYYEVKVLNLPLPSISATSLKIGWLSNTRFKGLSKSIDIVNVSSWTEFANPSKVSSTNFTNSHSSILGEGTSSLFCFDF